MRNSEQDFLRFWCLIYSVLLVAKQTISIFLDIVHLNRLSIAQQIWVRKSDYISYFQLSD